ncbi:MAG TPA: thioesterase family protein [Candidatus Marinimicrobia bacterium]|nr:thioesterase family protein [Candidatus Neomarinimicrobiota bacterium]HRS51173.1 thioesterase family protein [Candidatus Neomarinimicrobiota bacterium]HRU91588.1 thioesterase family protein [Candidatus Neomarinimicrobiota bacterium]
MLEHRYQLRVRYSSVDQLGVVYYSRYLEYFEAARDEIMRSIGLPYSQFEREGYAMPVVEVHCVYHRSAHFDELLTIISRISEMPTARLRIDYEILRENESQPIVTGYTIHAFVNQSGKAVRPPQFFTKLLEAQLLK